MPEVLSKVKEVAAYTHLDPVNKALSTGKWVLLEVKVTETVEWKAPTHMREAYVSKVSEVIYVLGRVK